MRSKEIKVHFRRNQQSQWNVHKVVEPDSITTWSGVRMILLITPTDGSGGTRWEIKILQGPVLITTNIMDENAINVRPKEIKDQFRRNLEVIT